MDINALTRDPESLLCDVEATLAFADSLDQSATYVARHLDQRPAIIQRLEQDLQADVAERFEKWWIALIPLFDTAVEPGEEVVAVTTGLAKVERNLIAGIRDHQSAVQSHEPLIRRLLFRLTSFTRIEDPKYYTLQSVLVQLLVNIVSPISTEVEDQRKADEKLALYLSGEREDDIVIRLLDSQNAKVNTATIHLISNLTRGSRPRTESLLSPTGIPWLSRLLNRLDSFHTTDPSEPSDRRFEQTTTLLHTFINYNLHSRLFANLASPDEPISPSQTILLKLLDSFYSNPDNCMAEGSGSASASDNRFLLPTFHLLSAYTLTSLMRVADDARLPKVFEGLHLVCEIVCNLGLGVQRKIDEAKARGQGGHGGIEVSEKHLNGEVEEGNDTGMGIDSEEGRNAAANVIEDARSAVAGVGVISPSVDLLRELERLLPRTNPRLARLARQGSTDPTLRSQPHTQTQPPPTTPIHSLPEDQTRPIAQLKRILVQLLGVLCFENVPAGDQVREKGGVEMVLSMTEVDEGNPYLREHALFLVRNLMWNNPANQEVIRRMDPVGVLSEGGEVLPLPESMRRGR